MKIARILSYTLIFCTTVASAQMDEAYRLANESVREKLRSENKENIRILDDLKKNDVIVVTGTYDHIDQVLTSLKIPFATIDQQQLLKATLVPHQTIFVNCASDFPAAAARKLAAFVAQGGQLITTDWALKNLLEVAFPNTVAYNNRPTADEVVQIEAIDKSDSVVIGFFEEKTDPVWWLESSSYPITILNREKVKVLIRSKELKTKYGEDAVVVKFKHGKGEVYHMISHFYLQRTETRDGIQAGEASAYLKDKGASEEQIKKAAGSKVTYGELQSANTSADFVTRVLIKQAKKKGK